MTYRQWAFTAVEIVHLAGLHFCRSDRETRFPRVQSPWIDQLFKRAFERLGRIIADTFRAQRQQAEKRRRIGLEEIVKAAGNDRHVCRPLPEQRRHPGQLRERWMCDPAPEFLEARQALLRRVAGNQARIDGADRGADHPVRLDAGFAQRLIDADLVGAERAAALQHEDDLAKALAIDCGDSGHAVLPSVVFVRGGARWAALVARDSVGATRLGDASATTSNTVNASASRLLFAR
jgi:hypothetical protein